MEKAIPTPQLTATNNIPGGQPTMSDLYHTLDEVLVQKIELYDELIGVMKEEWASISEYSREKLENALERKIIIVGQSSRV